MTFSRQLNSTLQDLRQESNVVRFSLQKWLCRYVGGGYNRAAGYIYRRVRTAQDQNSVSRGGDPFRTDS